LDSLYFVQTLNSVICELPIKLATALHIDNLEKNNERGLHVLISTSTILLGFLENEKNRCDVVSVKNLREEFDVLLYMLKKRLPLNLICNQINVFLFKLQVTKIACHIYLNFAYGEHFAVQTSSK